MRIIFLCSLLLSLQSSKATTYYVSTDGSDAASGLSPAAAWQSLSKLQSELFSMGGGDTVLLRRGDVFRGKLEVYNSGSSSQNLVIAAYGTGPRPIIDGSRSISGGGWVNTGSTRWRKGIPAFWPKPEILVLGGDVQSIGRWPNTDEGLAGYYNIDSHFGDSEITSSALAAAPDFTGGEFVSRTQNWVMDRLEITAQIGTTLTLGPGASYDPRDGYGFFIQHHPETLDRHGEWAYDQPNQDVYLRWPTNPGSLQIDLAVEPFGIQFFDLANVVVRDLHIRWTAGAGIKLDLVDQVEVSNCTFEAVAVDGIFCVDATNTSLLNNTFDRCQSSGISIPYGSSGLTIAGNKLLQCGMETGAAPSGFNRYSGIIAIGDDIQIISNIIDEVGYNGIRFEGNNVVVEKNLIRRHGSVLDDCGGIYTWSDGTIYTNRIVRNNIVLEGRGNGQGTDAPDFGFAVGIYMDDRTRNVEISSNTLAHNSSAGIYLHNAAAILVANNLMFNNEEQLKLTHDSIAPTYPIRSCTITGNQMVAREASQLTLSLSSIRTDFDSVGMLDNNIYARPLKPFGSIKTKLSFGNFEREFFDLPSWQDAYSYDLSSQAEPMEVPYYSVAAYLSPELVLNGNFNAGTSDWYCFNPSGTCGLNWESSAWAGGAATHSFTSYPVDEYSLITTSSGIGAISADDWVELKFTASSTMDHMKMRVNLRQNAPPFNDLSPRAYTVVNSTVEERSILLQSEGSFSNARLDFRVFAADSSDFTFDGVSARIIQPDFTDPDQHMAFFLNHKQTPRSFSVPFPVLDIFGNLQSGTVSIPPLGGIVLFRPPALRVELGQEFALSPVSVSPNPATTRGEIIFQGLDEEVADFSLRSLDGKEVLAVQELAGSNSIRLPQLAAGIYLWQLQTTTSSYSGKLAVK